MPRQSTLKKRAAAGAAYLDKREPGWADKINLASLDMSFCVTCVIGQLYGDYYEYYKMPLSWKEDLGFTILPDKAPSKKEWEELTECWKDEILARGGPR